MSFLRILLFTASLLFFITTITIITCSAKESVNDSNNTGQMYWASAKEEGDSPEDEFDGGFSSLESMLQWSIGHADPIKLKEAAEDAQCLSTSDLKKRQEEIKELMETLKTPSDAELMKTAIADLNNSSLSLEQHLRALEELLVLVEMIDNANDMNKFGGLAAVIRELNTSDQQMRIISAWILGMASQNNPVVQNQASRHIHLQTLMKLVSLVSSFIMQRFLLHILDLGALKKLIKMANSSSAEEATKALYAIAALIRNSIDGQTLFYAEAGELMLQDIMSSSSVDIRLKKKAASLVADLANFQLESKNKAGSLSLSSRFFLKSVVDLTTFTDVDLQEKALVAIKNLLQLNASEALYFRDFCGFDKVLESMREQLRQLMTVEDQSDFLLDMESLLGDVELIFQKKLERYHSSLDFNL
ncbi:hypothetical protein IFM89_010110 [Coptis chinensis]|uniref:Nucleotide exchange factor Fes1 domain-containing protein n=1 Tax=Coptis chinensis TaxID=261450 RepID=A0A835HYT5_9MAGN|nr:hypothetical protein IFM89_010110 [Coptis chinensis]